MPDISNTGDGLSIVIKCDYVPHHDWMSFASWYSITKNLPDAKVRMVCKRSGTPLQMFRWTRKVRVPFIQSSIEPQPTSDDLWITPDVMAVSTYDAENLGPVSVKENVVFTFASYLKGCGKFVLGEWINKRCPFQMSQRFYATDLTLNEYRVLRLWEKAFNSYVACN